MQESTPAMQVPVEAHAPTPHAVAKLSATPLQSLSSPSQISAEGLTLRTHWIDPLEQVCVRAAQTPCWPVAQGAPAPGLPSSTVPSQSLSAPSQISGAGVPGTHVSTPAKHIPAAPHAPTPQLVAKLSTVPLQSLSRLSQTSAEGFTLRTHWSD